MAMAGVTDHVEIVYDGDCPVCAAYFRLQRLRDNGIEARLIDARGKPELLDRYAARGIDLNRDFVLRVNNKEYSGADAMAALAALGERRTFGRRITAAIFRSQALASLLYPLLRIGRYALLCVLRRPPIGQPKSQL
jgi:predicted DCC family thiol-disulfide oxidoreductase YuxK